METHYQYQNIDMIGRRCITTALVVLLCSSEGSATSVAVLSNFTSITNMSGDSHLMDYLQVIGTHFEGLI